MKLYQKLALNAVALALVTFFSMLVGSGLTTGDYTGTGALTTALVSAAIAAGFTFATNLVIAIKAIQPDDDKNMDDKVDPKEPVNRSNPDNRDKKHDIPMLGFF